MLYVVFDTNVIVSAMVSHNPNAATVKVVEAISLGKIVPLYNEEILAEYDDVLHRAKFNLLDRDVSSMIGTIIKLGMLMDRTESKETLVDLSDLVFYEVALSKEGALVVTGNLKQFPQSPIVVTPSELLMMIY
jgi:putative PIN family toxin of toxin-antitoxin system